jgi:CBS domain containing-hemolysin-like protein
MSTGWAIGLSLVLLAANAFFVGAEFALISARRSVIEPRAVEGGRRARVTLKAMERVSLMIAGAQLGITVCSLGLGYLGEPAIAHVLEGPFEQVGVPESLVHPIAFAIALSLIGFLHVVLGEMVPKNLALAAPDRAALALAPPLSVVVRGLRPVIALLNWIANVTLRLVGVMPKDEVTSAFTRDEVAGLVDESRREGLLDQHEGRLLVGALKFEERDARSVLLPPESLQTVAPDITPSQFEHVAARTGFSRFPVAAGGRFLGYLHSRTSWSSRRSTATARSRGGGSARCPSCATRTACARCWPRCRPRARISPRSRTTRGRSWASWRSRTSSRSSWARSATSPERPRGGAAGTPPDGGGPRLVVLPADLVDAGEGWSAAGGAVRPEAVVVAQEACQ